MYSDICGYTEADLDRVFGPELDGTSTATRIRAWYNGYGWRGPGKVYNPFDILLLFRTREFKAHWFETGTPTFLVDTLVKRRVGPPELERMVATDELVSRFDVDDIATEALLFQTGYLTIVGERRRGDRSIYELGYPNQEVRESLNGSLLRHLTRDPQIVAKGVRLYDLLEADDFDGLRELIHGFYAGIPHEWYTNNDIATYEGYYAAVFYAYFASAGTGRPGGGQHEPGPLGHGGAVRRHGVHVRIQGRRTGWGGDGADATAGERLRREVPGPGRTRAPWSVSSSAARRATSRDSTCPGRAPTDDSLRSPPGREQNLERHWLLHGLSMVHVTKPGRPCSHSHSLARLAHCLAASPPVRWQARLSRVELAAAAVCR